jgi:hypothetical protein
MKAHIWYSTTGKANKNAAIINILRGTMKGEMTEVAIRVVPAGKLATKGAANKSYSSAGPGKMANMAAGNADGRDGAHQPVAQFHEVRDKGLFGARQVRLRAWGWGWGRCRTLEN